jgi:hypothetical protein
MTVESSSAPGPDFGALKEDALGLIEATHALAAERGAQAAADRLGAARTRLLDGRLQVVVCGEFKQGKSSLINALLGEPGLLPTDVDISTAVVTTIAWGETERILAFLGEPGQEEATPISRARLADYVTEAGNPANRRRVRLVDIRLPNPLLADGLVLVDTPGIGGIAIEHSELTFGFLPTADLVLFVTSAQAPLTTHELDFLRRRVLPLGREVLVAMNRIDRQRDWRVILEANRDKLAEVLDRAPEQVWIRPVSARGQLDFLAQGDPQDAAEGRVPALQAEMLAHLGAHGGRLLLEGACREVAHALAELRAPLATAHRAMAAEAGTKLDAIEAELAAAQRRLDELRDRGAQWRRDLTYGFQDIRREQAYAEQAGAARLRTNLETRLADPAQLQDPARIGREAAADLQTFRAMRTMRLVDAVTALRASVARSAGIALPGPGGDVPNAPETGPAPDTGGARIRQGLLRRAVATGRGASGAMTGGTLAGAAFGAIVGGALGFLAGGAGAVPGAKLGASIGGMIGTVTGIGEALENIDQREDAETRATVQRLIGPYLAEGAVALRRFHDDLLVRLERTSASEFEEEIRREQRIVAGQQKAVAERRRLSKAEAIARSKEIEAALAALDALDARRRALMDGLGAQPRAARAGDASPGMAPEAAPRGPAGVRDIGLAG